VARGKVRDGLAHRDPVAQAIQPGVHGRAVHPADERLLEVDRAGVRRGEPDPLREGRPFRTVKTPPAGIAIQNGGDPPRIRLNMPRLGPPGRQATSRWHSSRQ
jgi:hypothetical protein